MRNYFYLEKYPNLHITIKFILFTIDEINLRQFVETESEPDWYLSGQR